MYNETQNRFAIKHRVVITLLVETCKPVEGLSDKIKNRAFTMDGVENVEVIETVDADAT